MGWVEPMGNPTHRGLGWVMGPSFNNPTHSRVGFVKVSNPRGYPWVVYNPWVMGTLQPCITLQNYNTNPINFSHKSY